MKLNKLTKRIFVSSFLAALMLIIIKVPAMAAIENPVIGALGESAGADDGSKFVEYMVYLWKVAINLGALTVIVFFLLAAYEWITSEGDSGKLEKARGRMINAVVGLVLLVGSFVILNFLSKILFHNEFDILDLTFPTRVTSTNSDGTTTTLTPPANLNPNTNPNGFDRNGNVETSTNFDFLD